MWRWLLLSILLVVGLDRVSAVQAQETPPQIVGTLYYQRGLGQDREYIRRTSEGSSTFQESIAEFHDHYSNYSLSAPPLPDLMPNLFLYPEGFYLKSPIFPFYVYLRCPELQISYYRSEIYQDKFAFCDEEYNIIYDAETNEEISQLEGDQVARQTGLAFTYPFQWSPSGRYLAYSPTLCGILSREACPHIRIYDAVAREYIDTSATAREDSWFVFAALDHALQWSPSERYIAFLQSPNAATKSFEFITIFDSVTNSIARSIPFDFAGGNMNWLWSPDSQSIAYVKAEGQLVQINVRDGSSELLDTNVARIIAWTE